jgi:superfamily I DNA/RNA helicase
MTLDFFEGAAGTGKTHNLVGRASERVHEGLLGEDHHRVLALTFMNGARRRLEARLGQSALFRRRFQCQTFDVFARTVVTRRKSLLSGNTAVLGQAATFNEFDGPCFLAGKLLEMTPVQQWVAASFPLILVDEAQDLDDHRTRILQGLSAQCSIVAAADAFQCLVDGRDTTNVMGWLEGAGQTHRLTRPRRTTQQGLLAAANAVRNGQPIRDVLIKSQTSQTPTWNGQGFRLIETHAKSAGLVAWAISNEMAQHSGQHAILTPDSKNVMLRTALDMVRKRPWTRKKNGQTFGPFPVAWEMEDLEAAAELIAGIKLPPSASYADCCAVLKPIASHAAVAQTIARLDRLRRVCGQDSFTVAQVGDFVREAVRNQSRLGFRQQRGNLAMTVQRAKNREFQNVIVLWPHTAMGSTEHLRRLLYNAIITRAISHCTVIVLGMGRLERPPFA